MACKKCGKDEHYASTCGRKPKGPPYKKPTLADDANELLAGGAKAKRGRSKRAASKRIASKPPRGPARARRAAVVEQVASPGTTNVVLPVDRRELGELRAGLARLFADVGALIDRILAGHTVADVLRGLADHVAGVEAGPRGKAPLALPAARSVAPVRPAPTPRQPRRPARQAAPAVEEDEDEDDEASEEVHLEDEGDLDADDAGDGERDLPPSFRLPQTPPPRPVSSPSVAPPAATATPGAPLYRVVDRNGNTLSEHNDFSRATCAVHDHPEGHVVISIATGNALTQPVERRMAG